MGRTTYARFDTAAKVCLPYRRIFDSIRHTAVNLLLSCLWPKVSATRKDKMAQVIITLATKVLVTLAGIAEGYASATKAATKADWQLAAFLAEATPKKNRKAWQLAVAEAIGQNLPYVQRVSRAGMAVQSLVAQDLITWQAAEAGNVGLSVIEQKLKVAAVGPKADGTPKAATKKLAVQLAAGSLKAVQPHVKAAKAATAKAEAAERKLAKVTRKAAGVVSSGESTAKATLAEVIHEVGTLREAVRTIIKAERPTAHDLKAVQALADSFTKLAAEAATLAAAAAAKATTS